MDALFDILHVLIGAVGGLIGFGAGVLASKMANRHTGVEPVANLARTDRSPHTHRYDTMLSDGKFRCGICNKVKSNG